MSTQHLHQKHHKNLQILMVILFFLVVPLDALSQPETDQFKLYPLNQRPTASFTSGPSGKANENRDPRTLAIKDWLIKHVKNAKNDNDDGNALGPQQDRILAQQEGIKRLKSKTDNNLQVRFRKSCGTPSQIKGGILETGLSGFAKGAHAATEQTARNFLLNNRDLLCIEDPENEFVLVNRQEDELGRQCLRYSQYFNGVPLWPCELTVHIDSSGNVDLVEGAYMPTPKNIGTTPLISAEIAISRTKGSLAPAAVAIDTEADLILFGSLVSPVRLAWKFDFVANPEQAWRCVVDALTGKILMRYILTQHAAATGSGADGLGNSRALNLWEEGGTFFMVDASKGMFDANSAPPNNARGAIHIFDAGNREVTDPQFAAGLVRSNSADSGWIVDAVDAAFGLSETFDYYLERHNRNSLDGQGGNIRSIIQFGQDVQNAFWFQGTKTMVFGNGFTKSIDVSGHELTHGVIGSIGNGGILEYVNQSGALNEALADLFGEMVEARTNGQPDWLKGEQLGLPNGPIQNYANPNSIEFAPGRPNPANMTQFVDLPITQDNGGVHINSSIINHCFYLLAVGLEGAIGLNDTEQIFYRAMTIHLQKLSQFIDMRLGCVSSAEEIFGADSVQVQKTKEAFDTVEIFDAPTTPSPTPIPTVQGPDSTLFLASVRDENNNVSTQLIRREDGLDNGEKTILSTPESPSLRRPSVSGDGSFAIYVTESSDIGLITTDNSEASVLGFPNTVFSAAVAPNGTLFAFVLRDITNAPDFPPTNTITIIDITTNTPRSIDLFLPVLDGDPLDVIEFADAMTFTADSQKIVYDAFSVLPTDTGQLEGWTLFSLDLETQTIQALIDLNENVDFGNPSLGKTRDHLITYEVVDRNTAISTIFAGDLVTGNVQEIATLNVAGGIATPGYTGDDKGIIYSQGDNAALTEFSLFRREVGGDGITPAAEPTVWLNDGAYGVIYRRGTFDSTNQLPTISISQPTQDEEFTAPATITVAVAASDDDGEVARVEFYQGSDLLFEDMETPFEFTWLDVQTGSYRLFARAIDNLGGAADSAPVDIAVAGETMVPTITTQPQNQTAMAGQTVTFSVAATGAEPFTFQWRHNEVNIDQATEATLTLENVQAANGGNYDVVVSNAAGTVTSSAATLTLTPAEHMVPTIATQPQNQTAMAGGTVTFSVAATGAEPITFQWRHNEVNIDQATEATLTLENVQAANEGNYDVVVSNAAGTLTSSAATLTVTTEENPTHPADNSPKDNRITIDEVTAYGAAWKKGEPWPIEPNPIPIDYVTRAGALWKGGETYTFDPEKTAPLWWVNGNAN